MISTKVLRIAACALTLLTPCQGSKEKIIEGTFQAAFWRGYLRISERPYVEYGTDSDLLISYKYDTKARLLTVAYHSGTYIGDEPDTETVDFSYVRLTVTRLRNKKYDNRVEIYIDLWNRARRFYGAFVAKPEHDDLLETFWDDPKIRTVEKGTFLVSRWGGVQYGANSDLTMKYTYSSTHKFLDVEYDSGSFWSNKPKTFKLADPDNGIVISQKQIEVNEQLSWSEIQIREGSDYVSFQIEKGWGRDLRDILKKLFPKAFTHDDHRRLLRLVKETERAADL